MQNLVMRTLEKLTREHTPNLFIFTFWSGPEGECVAAFEWTLQDMDSDFNTFCIVADGDRNWEICIKKLCEKALEGF